MSLGIPPAHQLRTTYTAEELAKRTMYLEVIRRVVLEKLMVESREKVIAVDRCEETTGDKNETLEATLLTFTIRPSPQRTTGFKLRSDESPQYNPELISHIAINGETKEVWVCFGGLIPPNNNVKYFRMAEVFEGIGDRGKDPNDNLSDEIKQLSREFAPLGYTLKVSTDEKSVGKTARIYLTWQNANYSIKN